VYGKEIEYDLEHVVVVDSEDQTAVVDVVVVDNEDRCSELGIVEVDRVVHEEVKQEEEKFEHAQLDLQELDDDEKKLVAVVFVVAITEDLVKAFADPLKFETCDQLKYYRHHF
jgi:hypothetical protein